jgi:type 1 fimbria pilin
MMRTRLKLLTSFLSIVMAALPGTTFALDHWDVEGAHGEIQVRGALTEGVCRLDMLSRWQEVELGATSTAELQHPGDHSVPVTFLLRLKDCSRKGGRLVDKRTGSVAWDSIQPVLSVRFQAQADTDNPELVGVIGAEGIGLRLTDYRGQDVRLGEQGPAQFISPAQDELVYNVSLERTSAPLTAGEYSATLNFVLEYD